MGYPLTRPFIDEKEVKAVREVLLSGWVAQGPKCVEFEHKIEEYLGVKYAITVCNCTAGLHLALLACGIKQGDEVVVSDYTYPATGFAPMYCGAKPVFVDILRTTYNIDPNQIPNSITSKTKAIIPVHTFGQPSLMYSIMELARKKGLWVIEDAACALGAKYRGDFAGTIGDVGVFSLHARKGITTGEGGIVVTNNEELATKIRRLSSFGVKRTYEILERDRYNSIGFDILGYNYKMSDLAAAVGIVQLSKLDLIIDLRRDLAKRWDENLKNNRKGNRRIQIPIIAPDCESVYQSYVVTLSKGVNRVKLMRWLDKFGIQSQIGTYACHLLKVFDCDYSLIRSANVFRTAIALPLYPQLVEEDIDILSKAVLVGLEEI